MRKSKLVLTIWFHSNELYGKYFILVPPARVNPYYWQTRSILGLLTSLPWPERSPPAMLLTLSYSQVTVFFKSEFRPHSYFQCRWLNQNVIYSSCFFITVQRVSYWLVDGMSQVCCRCIKLFMRNNKTYSITKVIECSFDLFPNCSLI